MTDPYAVLGITRAATADQVRAAYRRLAAELHPDRNPGNAAAAWRFREVSEAYSSINSGAGQGQSTRAVEVEEISPIIAMGEIVGGFFDILLGAGPRMRYDSAERRATVKIDRLSAARGARREIEVPWDAPCVQCAGSGGEPGGACVSCNGSGMTGTNLGLLKLVATCRTCGGSGRATRPCLECGGVGAQARQERVEIDIPAGIRDGARLLYRGKGLKDSSGRPLELLVDVTVEA